MSALSGRFARVEKPTLNNKVKQYKIVSQPLGFECEFTKEINQLIREGWQFEQNADQQNFSIVDKNIIAVMFRHEI